MAKTYPYQTNFTGGEWSSLLRGRVDLAKYGNAMLDAENIIVFPQGGFTRRGGLSYIAAAKTNKAVRLIPFVFSQTPENSHVLEFGCVLSTSAYIRVYDVVDDSNSAEITTLKDGSTLLPWGLRSGSYDSDATCISDLADIDYVQINDVMYLVDGQHDMYKLVRSGSTPDWTVEKVNAIGETFTLNKQMRYRLYTITNDAYNALAPGHPASSDMQSLLLDKEQDGVELIEIGDHTASTYGCAWGSAEPYDAVPQYISDELNQGWIRGSQVWGWVFDAQIWIPTNEKYYFAINGETSVDLSIDSKIVTPSDAYGLHDNASENHNQGDATEFEWNGSATDTDSDVLSGSVHHAIQVRVVNNGGSPQGSDVTYGIAAAWRNGGDLAADSENSGTDDLRLNTTHWYGNEIWEAKFTIEAGGTTFKWETRQQTSVDTDSYSSWVEVATGLTIASYVGAGNSYDANDTVNASHDLGDIYFATGSGLVAGDYWTMKFGFEVIPKTQFTKHSSTSTNSYPRHIALYQDRLGLLGFSEEPQRQLFSRPGLYENFTQGANDDDAFELHITGKETNPIMAAAEIGVGLVVFTQGGIYLTRGTDESFAPKNVSSKKKSGLKAGDIRPIVAHNKIIWVDRNELKLHDLGFDFVTDSFVINDLSIMSSSLTTGIIKELAIQYTSYQSADTDPFTVIWLIDDAGTLRSITYEPDHQIIAWVPHTIDSSTVLSICSVPSQNGEELWALLTVGSADQIFKLDKDLTKDTFSGGTNVFESIGQTMPLEYVDNRNSTQGFKKRLSEVFVKLLNTTGITVTNGKSTETLNDAAVATTQDKKFHMLGWGREQTIKISQASDNPMTILSVYGKMELTDT